MVCAAARAQTLPRAARAGARAGARAAAHSSADDAARLAGLDVALSPFAVRARDAPRHARRVSGHAGAGRRRDTRVLGHAAVSSEGARARAPMS